MRHGEVTAALGHVIEANTLLSGVGFESGGLAGAHAVAQGLTVLPQLNANYLHGEMVALGLMTQLLLEKRADEGARVAQFLCAVGLPCHLGHLSLDVSCSADLAAVMAGTSIVPFLANEPFVVDAELLLAATLGCRQAGAPDRGAARRCRLSCAARRLSRGNALDFIQYPYRNHRHA